MRGIDEICSVCAEDCKKEKLEHVCKKFKFKKKEGEMKGGIKKKKQQKPKSMD